MSATTRTDLSATIDGDRLDDVVPIVVDAESLESTAPTYLSDLKRTLSAEGFQPARIRVSTRLDSDSSLSVQDEVDRLRGYVRAASLLGAGTITVESEAVADTDVVHSALQACAERAERDGVRFEFDGPIELTG